MDVLIWINTLIYLRVGLARSYSVCGFARGPQEFRVSFPRRARKPCNPRTAYNAARIPSLIKQQAVAQLRDAPFKDDLLQYIIGRIVEVAKPNRLGRYRLPSSFRVLWTGLTRIFTIGS